MEGEAAAQGELGVEVEDPDVRVLCLPIAGEVDSCFAVLDEEADLHSMSASYAEIDTRLHRSATGLEIARVSPVRCQCQTENDLPSVETLTGRSDVSPRYGLARVWDPEGGRVADPTESGYDNGLNDCNRGTRLSVEEKRIPF